MTRNGKQPNSRSSPDVWKRYLPVDLFYHPKCSGCTDNDVEMEHRPFVGNCYSSTTRTEITEDERGPFLVHRGGSWHTEDSRTTPLTEGKVTVAGIGTQNTRLSWVLRRYTYEILMSTRRKLERGDVTLLHVYLVEENVRPALLLLWSLSSFSRRENLGWHFEKTYRYVQTLSYEGVILNHFLLPI